MSALSRVSFPGPDFASPAGPVGSKLSGAWAATFCGLSSSESGGPAALQRGGAHEGGVVGRPETSLHVETNENRLFPGTPPRESRAQNQVLAQDTRGSIWSPCPHLLSCTSSGLSLRAPCPRTIFSQVHEGYSQREGADTCSVLMCLHSGLCK